MPSSACSDGLKPLNRQKWRSSSALGSFFDVVSLFQISGILSGKYGGMIWRPISIKAAKRSSFTKEAYTNAF